MSDKIANEITFSKPGVYHIQVLGEICGDLRENFEIETEQVIVDKNGKIVTTLKIQVRDQAELSGLINTLYNRKLILLSIKIEGMSE